MDKELPRVSWSALRNGADGIAVGSEEYFLDVNFDGDGRLRVQLLNLMDGVRPVTAWISLRQPEDLRTSHHANLLRKTLRRVFKGQGEEVLEQIILLLQEHVEENGELNGAVPENPSLVDMDVEELIEAEAQRVLEAANMLEALKPHLDRVVVGEYENKQAILVLLAGSKYGEAEKKQIILLKGTEGGGKTTLAGTLTGFYKTKRVGRFSEHALEYSNLEGYEVLYIQELGSMDMDRQGVASIKFLSADDKGFTVEYTVRDAETGRFKTVQKRIPAITTVSTTTRLILDSQFERRAWLFNVDEGREQTERVKRWKAWMGRQRDEVKLGIRKITDYDFSIEVLRRVVAEIKPQRIVIPFREALADILSSNVLRARGDIDKLYSFIELYALFNLKRLQRIGGGAYAVTPEVAIEALNIIAKPLSAMMGGGDDRIKPLIDVMREMEIKALDAIDKGVRETVAIKLGKSEVTVRLYLNYLEQRGILSSDNKKPKTYTLLYPLEEVEEKISVLSLKSKINDELRGKMEKEAREWLQNLSLKPTPMDTHAFLEEKTEGGIRIDETEAPTNQEKAYASAEAGFNDPISRLSHPSPAEISLKNRENEKLTIIRMDSDGWNQGGWFKWKRIKPSGPCELCGEHPTEYLIHIREWGTTLQRCEACFNDFRKSFGGIP